MHNYKCLIKKLKPGLPLHWWRGNEGEGLNDEQRIKVEMLNY